MRLTCTLGTSPCSAMATNVASRIRRCAAVGIVPASSNQKCSVKLMRPINSSVRLRPRTRMVDSFEAEIAVVR